VTLSDTVALVAFPSVLHCPALPVHSLREVTENPCELEVREPSRSQCFGIELADSTVRPYDEREGEGVPVFVGVGRVLRTGFEGCPVFSVVARDVGAVGAYGDPEFLLGVVGYRGAIAVGWGLSEIPVSKAVG
jgi:hypothetical protein